MYNAPDACSRGPIGAKNSGAFNFSAFKAVLNTLHCRYKFMMKSLLKAPLARGQFLFSGTVCSLLQNQPVSFS